MRFSASRRVMFLLQINVLHLLMTRSRVKAHIMTQCKDEGDFKDPIIDYLFTINSCRDINRGTFTQREYYCSIQEILKRCPIACGRCGRKEEKDFLRLKAKSNNCTWLENNSAKNKWCADKWVQMECKDICYRSGLSAVSLAATDVFHGPTSRDVSQTEVDGKRIVKRKIARQRHLPKDALRLLERNTTALTSSSSTKAPSLSTKTPTSSKAPSTTVSTKVPSFTKSPSFSTKAPSTTSSPSLIQSALPSTAPSASVSNYPSISPSMIASSFPSSNPSSFPSSHTSSKPSLYPSEIPSIHPSVIASDTPSIHPSVIASDTPSIHPSAIHSKQPSTQPSTSQQPTTNPSSSSNPSSNPSESQAPTETPPKPNILVIMTDEHNMRTISAYRNYLLEKTGSKEDVDVWGLDQFVNTPNIDRIAKGGALYSNFYTVAPLCTPSRASFMTGMYPNHTGASGNSLPLDPNLKTFADILSDELFYHTAYFGKWHLDGTPKPGYGANDRTFGWKFNKYRYNRGHWKYITETNGKLNEYLTEEEWLNDNPVDPDPLKSYTTDFFTNRAIEYMQRKVDNGRRFAAFLSLVDPHGPNNTREPYRDMYKDYYFKLPQSAILNAKSNPPPPVWSTFGQDFYDREEYPLDSIDELLSEYESSNDWQIYMRWYFGMVACLDENIGKILDAIEDMGIQDDTIVIFTSDHGDLLREHGRQNKGQAYEMSASIPFMIRYPRKIKPGKVVETAYSSIDFFPTLMGLITDKDSILSDVDLQVHGVDGSEELLSTEQYSNDGEKCIITYDVRGRWVAAVHSMGYKLVVGRTATGEGAYLYDLNVDPNEMINFIDSEDLADVKLQLQIVLSDALSKYDLLNPNENNVINTSDLYLDSVACHDNRSIFESTERAEFITCDAVTTEDCNDRDIFENCRNTCNSCECEDSSGPMFIKGAFVESCEKMEEFCNRSKKIRHFCRKTCEVCNE